MGSLSFTDHVEPVTRSLSLMKDISVLNMAGCSFNLTTARILAKFVVFSFSIRELDVSHCKISFQASRYIIDALNRNTCIRVFNFSYNDLQTANYEFAIKLASTITRHPTMMHLNVAHTNLKREEVMFVVLALSISKTLVALHITAAGLPYYERIFLRAVIAARVGYQFRHLSNRKEIKSNREKNQILGMASGEGEQAEMQVYLDMFRKLDEKRQGLDFEIHDMLHEMDTQASFQDLESVSAENIPEDSMVGKLIGKLISR